jgi:tryptophanyl-tRNA synthetase
LANEEQLAAMTANYLGGNYGYSQNKLFELITQNSKPKGKIFIT